MKNLKRVDFFFLNVLFKITFWLLWISCKPLSKSCTISLLVISSSLSACLVCDGIIASSLQRKAANIKERRQRINLFFIFFQQLNSSQFVDVWLFLQWLSIIYYIYICTKNETFMSLLVFKRTLEYLRLPVGLSMYCRQYSWRQSNQRPGTQRQIFSRRVLQQTKVSDQRYFTGNWIPSLFVFMELAYEIGETKFGEEKLESFLKFIFEFSSRVSHVLGISTVWYLVVVVDVVIII